jgi:hypothetical protein
MADITKCSGEGCHMKETCYRYTAPSSEYQSYFMGTPLNDDKTCDEHWEIK